MPSGRIFRFIGFNGGENADEDCTSAPKKTDDRPNFGGSHFWRSGSLDLGFSILFFNHFNVFSDS